MGNACCWWRVGAAAWLLQAWDVLGEAWVESHHLCFPAGVRMGSLGLFLQCITSIFFSTIMDRMVTRFGARAVYLSSVVFFPGAAIVMCLSHSVTVVTISAALTGFTFSALQILPYTLASLYHHEKQVGISSRVL